MEADPREWRKLPKFIIADSDSRNEGGERDIQLSYVIHCHEPRFLMAFQFGKENNIFLIDSTDDEEMLISLLNKARQIFWERNPSLRH